MSSITPPPVYDYMIDQEGKANLSWILYFNSLYEGDTGTAWTPTFTNLTTVGTPTITGKYYRFGGKRLCFFHVTITPATSTTSTAASTYIDNFPLSFANDGFCIAVSGGSGTTAGHAVAANGRIYTPAWSAVTLPVHILGFAEIL